ncbi:WASH complex subunit 3 [Apis mellifera]|uniref:WASH complex subunit 3 n=1 Tax=Apis mellifera TaxID=7460 RepID=A0A7M7H018_APIME|nr:WASH complex subunit 3 [Apis mellifera]XP_006567311.1 WASH complex subunit 3 [Apis mellifera]XP_016767424.1 WASH complex subunit 3 [Apis mellifera]|eukprot:XP_006567310.1 WASH complex subunit 3 [Apis mellifera]
MNDYKIPIIEPTIDCTKVPPINQKRTISFINHFIVHTVTFLNKFTLSCEERLLQFEYKLQRIEASLEILESWLSSIPGLEQNQNTKNSTENNDSKEENVSKINEPDNTKQDVSEDIQTEKQLINKDSRYEKYLKMIHFGVPKEAVKLKMEQEGLNSSILDNESQQVISKQISTENDKDKED